MTATDIAAWWGAGIATVVVLFDAFKWWRGRATEIRISASPNMQVVDAIHGLLDQSHVFVEVTNVGDRTTTLTQLGGFIYSSWWTERLNKQTQAFVISDPSPGVLPHQLGPGQRWTGMINQTEEVEKWSREGRMYIAIRHALAKKAQLVRLVIPESSDANE